MILILEKRKKTKKWAAVLCAVVVLLAVCAYFALDNRLSVTKYTVSSDKIPISFDGYKIVQLTDLHCARFGENQQELVEQIAVLSPDLIVFTGDMIDQYLLDFDPIEELCSALSEKYLVLAIWGNHEKALSYSDFEKMKKLYRQYNIEILYGDTAYIERGGSCIAISGADDPACWNDDAVDFVNENGIGVYPAEGLYNILLYHRANIFPALTDLGFDLILAGHMHGGQIRIPLAGGLISPTMQWFPKYTAGRYDENGTKMIVGRGLGNAIKVPRVFNPPEIVSITLKST